LWLFDALPSYKFIYTKKLIHSTLDGGYLVDELVSPAQ